MKKLLTVLLATATVFSMSVSSFATGIGSGAVPNSAGGIGTGAEPTSNNGGGGIGTGAYPTGGVGTGRTQTHTGSETLKTNNITNIYDADNAPVSWDETVEPGNTYYIQLDSGIAFSEWASSSSNARVTTKKIKNGSLIKSIGLVEKRLNGGSRKSYLQVVLNDTTSADEIRVDFSVTFTAKKDMAASMVIGNDTFFLARNDYLTLTTTLYVCNENVDGGDTTVEVGKTGAYVKPIGGETNEVIFEDSNDVIATLTFDAASNPSKFYAKVTTNWTTATIKKFQNTDAVIRTFYPATIDARSRARLALANPYDTERHNPTKVWIYSIDSKGNVTDISKSFKYNTELDAYTTYVRTLGTYVISNVKISTK